MSDIDRVWLRPVLEADLELLYQHQAEPEAVRMGGYTPRSRDEELAQWRALLPDPTFAARTVMLGDSVAGSVSAWTHASERNLGYVLGRSFWGRGIATRAVVLFLDIETTRPLHAHVAAGNVASLRLLSKLGFQRTAELPPDPQGVVLHRLTIEAHGLDLTDVTRTHDMYSDVTKSHDRPAVARTRVAQPGHPSEGDHPCTCSSPALPAGSERP